MKKIYLLLFTLISLNSFSQTLVQSDLPFAGLGWVSGVDTNFTDPMLPGGAGQTWDYSTLVTEYTDTSGFQDAAGTLYAASFPSANLASHKAGTNNWTYFTNNSSGFYINGVGTDTLLLPFNPPQMYVPVPFSYGDSHTDISRVVIDTTYTGAPARVILNFNCQFSADGYGTLITPTTTYPSTLRVKEITLETDSLMLDPLSTGNYILLGSQVSQKQTFRWFQHGATANYILGIDADSLGNYGVKSDYVQQWAVLGTNDLNVEEGVSVFPNPTSGELKIKFAKSNPSFGGNEKLKINSVEIFNSTGAMVLAVQPQTSNLKLQTNIDVSELSSGIYFYCITTEEKQLRGKFSVVH